MSRDWHSFLLITCQDESILTLRHGGYSKSAYINMSIDCNVQFCMQDTFARACTRPKG